MSADVPHSKQFGLAWLIAVLLVAGLALVAIWWPAYTPGQDTPHHLFFARVVSDPDAFAADFEVVFAPTSQGFVYLASLVADLGLPTAGKLVRTLGLLLIVTAFMVLGRARGERRPVGLILGIASAASFYHAMGFENFALAVALGLLTLGLGLRAARQGRPRDWVLVAIGLAVTSLGHAVVAGMVGVELLLMVGLTAPSERRWRRVATAALAGAPAALHAAWSVWLSAQSQAERGIAAGLGTQRLPALEQVENIVLHSFGGYSNLGVLVVAAALLIALSGGLGKYRRLVAVTVAFWAVVYALAPFHAAGWAYAQPRVLAMLVLLPVGLLGWGRHRWLELGVATAAAACFLVSSAVNQHEAGAAIASQVARFGTEPVGRAMAVTLDPGHPPTSRHVGPLSGVEMYAVALGGAVPHVHAANPAIHAVIARRLPEQWPPHPPLFVYKSLDCHFNPDCRNAAVALAQRIAVQGLHYDAVLLVGGPERFREALVAFGYERSAPDRFRPRPGSLVIELGDHPALAELGLVVRAGYPEGMGWFAGAHRPAGAALEPLTLELGPLPAGPIQIDCRWATGGVGPGELDALPPACQGQATVVAGERQHIRIELLASGDGDR